MFFFKHIYDRFIFVISSSEISFKKQQQHSTSKKPQGHDAQHRDATVQRPESLVITVSGSPDVKGLAAFDEAVAE